LRRVVWLTQKRTLHPCEQSGESTLAPTPGFLHLDGSELPSVCFITSGDMTAFSSECCQAAKCSFYPSNFRFWPKADGGHCSIRRVLSATASRLRFTQEQICAVQLEMSLWAKSGHWGRLLSLISFATHSILCGALPGPTALNLGFQRETEEGSNQHNPG